MIAQSAVSVTFMSTNVIISLSSDSLAVILGAREFRPGAGGGLYAGERTWLQISSGRGSAALLLTASLMVRSPGL